jgi:hypothetical protein
VKCSLNGFLENVQYFLLIGNQCNRVSDTDSGESLVMQILQLLNWDVKGHQYGKVIIQ